MSASDSPFIDSVGFFWILNTIYLVAFGLIHLTHWFINLYLEFKQTKSCGAKERHEGTMGFVLLFVCFSVPMLYALIITFYTIVNSQFCLFKIFS